MIQFYRHYIHPESPARSKLAVHLNAQGSASTTTSGVAAIVEGGMKALGLHEDRKDDDSGEAAQTKVENGTTPFIITDVREFKSRLQISAGPQPVRHISEFEECDPKL